jgi:hypothetical protein
VADKPPAGATWLSAIAPLTYHPITPTISSTSLAAVNARGGHARDEPLIPDGAARRPREDMADKGRYGVTFVLRPPPSPLTGEGAGGGATAALVPPSLTFSRKGGRGLDRPPSAVRKGGGPPEATMPPDTGVKSPVMPGYARSHDASPRLTWGCRKRLGQYGVPA